MVHENTLKQYKCAFVSKEYALHGPARSNTMEQQQRGFERLLAISRKSFKIYFSFEDVDPYDQYNLCVWFRLMTTL